MPRPKALSTSDPVYLAAIAAAQRNLASNLKRLRAVRGFSQERLAEVADMSTAYISGLERAEARDENPSLTTLAVLAVALGCTAGALLDPPTSRGRKVPSRPPKAAATAKTKGKSRPAVRQGGKPRT